MGINLWLDDVRASPDDSWVWVKSFDEAALFLKQCITDGLKIDIAQLDHDLGGMAYNYCHECRGRVLTQEEFHQIFIHGCEHMKTGRHVVELMEALNVWPEVIIVHSWNPDGAKRMADIAAKHTETYLRAFGTEHCVQVTP